MHLFFEVKPRWRNALFPVSLRALLVNQPIAELNSASHSAADMSLKPVEETNLGEINLQLIDNSFTKKFSWPKASVNIQARPVVGCYTVAQTHLVDPSLVSASQEQSWITQAELLFACSRYMGLSSKEHAALCGISPMTAAKHAENFRRKIRPMRLSGYLLGQLLISYDALYYLINKKNPHPYLVDMPLKRAL